MTVKTQSYSLSLCELSQKSSSQTFSKARFVFYIICEVLSRFHCCGCKYLFRDFVELCKNCRLRYLFHLFQSLSLAKIFVSFVSKFKFSKDICFNCFKV